MKPGALIALSLIAGSVLAAGVLHIRVTDARHESEYPSLAWTGKALGICWMDGRDGNQELYFRVADIEKKRLGPEKRLTNSNNWDYRPSLVWNGSGFGLLWVHERRVKRDLYFALLDSNGAFNLGPVRIINQQMIEKHTRLAWTGSGYGLVFGDYKTGNLEIFYQALNEQGQKTGPETQLTRSPGKSELADLVFQNQEFALTFLDAREGTRQVYFMIFDVNGRVKVQTRISTLDTDCSPPSLASGPGGFGLAWCQQAGSSAQVFFAHMDANGQPLIKARALTGDDSQKTWAEIQAFDQAYGIAYYAGDRFYRTLYFCSVDQDANLRQSSNALTDPRKAEAACPLIRMVPDSTGMTIVWVDLGKNLNSEIYLTRLEF